MRVFSLFFTVQPRGLTFLLHRHQTGSQVVLVQCFVLSTTQRPYFFVNFWLSPDDPTYFCIFLSLNAKNHALTQWPLIFWACALTECPSLLEGGPYTRIHFIFDCPPGGSKLCIGIHLESAPDRLPYTMVLNFWGMCSCHVCAQNTIDFP